MYGNNVLANNFHPVNNDACSNTCVVRISDQTAVLLIFEIYFFLFPGLGGHLGMHSCRHTDSVVL